MKQHVLLFAVAIAAAAAGCGKSSDLAPVVAETAGLIKSYQPRVAELERRAQDLVRRRDALGLGVEAPANRLLASATGELIPTMQREMREADMKLRATAGDDKLDEAKKLAEVRLLSHQLRWGLGEDWIQANAQLDTVEAWVTRAEDQARMQKAAAAAAAATAPATTTPAPEPTPAAEPPAGGAGAPDR